jgi:hypothetical protein
MSSPIMLASPGKRKRRIGSHGRPSDHDGLRRAQGRSDQDHQIDVAQYQAARAYQEGLRSIRSALWVD